jgi:hypothetical protein
MKLLYVAEPDRMPICFLLPSPSRLSLSAGKFDAVDLGQHKGTAYQTLLFECNPDSTRHL